MTIKLVSQKVVSLTPELALRFRDMKALSNERPLQKMRAKRAVHLLQEDKFFTSLWGECRYQEKEDYRGNGNHTSNVFVCCFQAHSGEGELDEKAQAFFDDYLKGPGGEWQGSSPQDLPPIDDAGLKVLLEKFAADAPDDLVDFFRRYDPKESSRSAADVFGVYAGKWEDLNGLEKKKLGWALAGVRRLALLDPGAFGLSDASLIKRANGQVGALLDIPRIRDAARFIVETVPHEYLYNKVAGAQVFAEKWADHGPEKTEKIINEVVRQLDEEEEPAASWEASLNRKRNRPTLESLIKKGRNVLNAALANID